MLISNRVSADFLEIKIKKIQNKIYICVDLRKSVSPKKDFYWNLKGAIFLQPRDLRG